MFFLTEFKKVISYSRSPVYLERPVTHDKLHLFKVLPFLVLLDFLLSILSVFLLILFGAFPDNHVAGSLHYGTVVNVFIIAFLGPLLEETAFRLSMRYSSRGLALSIAVLSYFCLNIVLHVKNYDISNHFYQRTAFALCTGVLTYFVVKNRTPAMTQLWHKHFTSIYYCLTFSFAFIHLSNFHSLAWYLFPIATLPQLINAFILGYVRMHYGFVYSLAMHCFKNGLSGL